MSNFESNLYKDFSESQYTRPRKSLTDEPEGANFQ